MISNRDTNTNLAKAIEKKKREMQEINDAEKKRRMIAYIAIGSIALLLIGFAIFNSSDSDTKNTTEFATPETNGNEKYNSKLEALEAKQQKKSNSNLLDIFSNEKKDTIVSDSIYKNKLEENLEQYNENPKKAVVKTKGSTKRKKEVYGDYSMWEEEENESKREEKKELSYQEKLRIAREARSGKNMGVTKNSNSDIIETRVAIFRDQFLLPGEQANLVLTEDFIYNNKLFKKGTPVYAYININKNRVLFDIKNISHHPFQISVRDIKDGLNGMKSSQAGKLWKKYETEGVNDATQNISNNIGSNPILSNSIGAISSFFQKKRLNKNDKIMLLNDRELILSLK